VSIPPTTKGSPMDSPSVPAHFNSDSGYVGRLTCVPLIVQTESSIPGIPTKHRSFNRKPQYWVFQQSTGRSIGNLNTRYSNKAPVVQSATSIPGIPTKHRSFNRKPQYRVFQQSTGRSIGNLNTGYCEQVTRPPPRCSRPDPPRTRRLESARWSWPGPAIGFLRVV